MKFNTRVTGAREAEAAVKELSDKIGRGAMRDSLTKAARIMTAAVKRGAPTGATGLLKKSIKQKVVTNTRKQMVTAYVGPSNNVTGQVDRFGNGNITTVRPAKYAHLVEYGTASRGGYGRKGEIVTPGNPPRPFMRTAYASTKTTTLDKYKSELGPAIEKTAAKIRKRKVRT
jgi:HK97 gp10 family phage protein